MMIHFKQHTLAESLPGSIFGKRHTKIAMLAVAFTTLAMAGCGNTLSTAPEQAAQPMATTQSADTSAANTPTTGVGTASSFTVSSLTDSRNTITVNSTEQVTVAPDIAEVVYAVRTEARDAAACQQKNTEDISRVTELLKTMGIAETSIQTSNYYMYPVYNYSNNTQRITGYEATTTLTVSDLPIDNLGDILIESVSAGINNIQSITYQSSKYDEGYTEALKLAVASARNKADALAEAGGCTVGGVASIRENSNYGTARYTDNALTNQMRSYGALKEMTLEDATPIMPGEVDIEVNITVEYFIQ